MKYLLTALLLLALCPAATAETHRVSPSKSDQLQALFERLADGDTVIFERGTYKTAKALTLTGSKNISLRAEGRVEIVLDNLDAPVISISHCRAITIEGVRARHRQPSEEYVCEGAVIRVENSEEVAVVRCHLNGCGAAGVYATKSKALVLYDNTIFNNTFAGIWLYNSSGNIHKNRLHDNAADLITSGDCDITLTGNEIEGNEGNDFSQSQFFHRVVRGR